MRGQILSLRLCLCMGKVFHACTISMCFAQSARRRQNYRIGMGSGWASEIFFSPTAFSKWLGEPLQLFQVALGWFRSNVGYKKACTFRRAAACKDNSMSRFTMAAQEVQKPNVSATSRGVLSARTPFSGMDRETPLPHPSTWHRQSPPRLTRSEAGVQSRQRGGSLPLMSCFPQGQPLPLRPLQTGPQIEWSKRLRFRVELKQS